MLLTHIHTRLLHPSLTQLTDLDPPTPSRLRGPPGDVVRHPADASGEVGELAEQGPARDLGVAAVGDDASGMNNGGVSWADRSRCAGSRRDRGRGW